MLSGAPSVPSLPTVARLIDRVIPLASVTAKSDAEVAGGVVAAIKLSRGTS